MKISTGQLPGKWFPSLVRGRIAMACLVLGAATSAFAQHVSVGIKAGVPLTDVVETESSVLPLQAKTKRYTVGPVVDIGFPLGLGIEAGALYKRFDQESMTITTTGYIVQPDGDSYANQQTADISAAGQSWEFPVALQYHFLKSSIRPYVEGGVSFNHLSNVYSFENFFVPSVPIVGPRPLPFTIGPTIGSFYRIGGLFGLGLELMLHKIHVTPGIRYTYYGDKKQWLPATNAVDFLVGFTF